MNDEEMAALAVAVELVRGGAPAAQPGDDAAASRWKLAARRPELGLEDLRAL